jgi:hypothetical protein
MLAVCPVRSPAEGDAALMTSGKWIFLTEFAKPNGFLPAL